MTADSWPRFQSGYVTKLGRVCVEVTPSNQVSALCLPDLDDRNPQVVESASPLVEEIKRALGQYLQGDPTALLLLDLAPASSPFAAEVREAMRQVPYGTVATYGDIAAGVGRPKAARAVGRACGANPVPLIVPCHRIIAQSGLGGFGLGLRAKRTLLLLEGIDPDRLMARVSRNEETDHM